jgi:hypothetical protein
MEISEMCGTFYVENLRGRNLLEDPGMNGKLTFRWNL